ncbi:MAG: aa3-type cytochrome c oxidase subunit IV [Rhizomicrobium sp.]
MSETDEEILHQGGGHMSPADMKEHLKAWHGFVSFVTGGIIGNIVILVFLAIFRTHGG